MSKYKHGDWYCKPASEAETLEIIKRALVNGVKIGDSIDDGIGLLKWNVYPHWGVKNGYIDTGYYDWHTYDAIYTIEQVREKFPLPHEVKQ